MLTHGHKDIYIYKVLLIAAMFASKNDLRKPSIGYWLNHLWYILQRKIMLGFKKSYHLIWKDFQEYY